MEKGPLIEVEGAVPTLLVTWPNGKGIPGVDFTIGFDSGDPRRGLHTGLRLDDARGRQT